MKYCSPCAVMHDWEFFTRSDSRSYCEVCNCLRICDSRPIAKLPSRPKSYIDKRVMLKTLAGIVVEKRLSAWREYVGRVGELAAQEARYAALGQVGWTHTPGIGSTPADNLRDIRNSRDSALSDWRLWHEAMRLIDGMEKNHEAASVRGGGGSPARADSGTGDQDS